MSIAPHKEISGCDRSAHVIEIDTYECISLINGAYKWDLADVRHTTQSCKSYTGAKGQLHDSSHARVRTSPNVRYCPVAHNKI